MKLLQLVSQRICLQSMRGTLGRNSFVGISLYVSLHVSMAKESFSVLKEIKWVKRTMKDFHSQ